MDFKDVIGIISDGLEAAEKFGNRPLVSSIPYVSEVTSVVGAINELIQAGQEFEPLVLRLQATFKKDAPPPTDDEVAALRADTAAELAKLGAMPPREDGEPE